MDNEHGFTDENQPAESDLNKQSELVGLLTAIAYNSEMVITAGPRPQQDGLETRYNLTLNGPERLLKPLTDFLIGS